jgi:hypothetical protein
MCNNLYQISFKLDEIKHQNEDNETRTDCKSNNLDEDEPETTLN